MAKKSFTLIEILITVAIITILAIGVLAVLDPIEQFNRASDSTLNNLAAEYKNSLDRFYTSHSGQYPTSLSAGYTGSIGTGAGFDSVSELISLGEMKFNLTLNSNFTNIYLNMASGGLPVVCTQLKSKSFRGNPRAVYNISAQINSPACPNATNPSCSICLF